MTGKNKHCITDQCNITNWKKCTFKLSFDHFLYSKQTAQKVTLCIPDKYVKVNIVLTTGGI